MDFMKKYVDGVDYDDFTVRLSWYEVKMAEFVSEQRRTQSKKLNLKDKFGEMSEDYNKRINDLGAKSEIAVAKYLNQYFGGTVNTFHRISDVGINVEVRASERQSQSLIVRDKDSEDAYYFLVIELEYNIYRIVGFLKGSEAKNEQYYSSPNNRPKAYFIPQSELISPTRRNLKRHRLINL